MTKQPPLASKDASLFRQVLKNYETKQYKKGLRCAEQILKKNQKHGETLAMKGLILNCLGRHEEAFTIAKEALTLDMKSHVCWHVYGLLWRSVKNYDEAIKAYKQALKIEPDSQQILRDLAYLQVQTRDFMGYAESRRTILQGRPNIRANWTGLAIAYHLAGDLAGAENILTKFEGTLKKPPPKGTADYVEHSEAALYKNTIIAESLDFERALEHLESISKIVLDKLSVLESKAKYLLQLKRWEEAEKSYLALLNRNSDNREYYSALEQCWAKGADIQGAERSQFKTNYEELAEKYPKADSPKRVPLDFLEGDEFKAAADTYIRSLLQRGVPSTFANIKALYRDPTKREVIPQIVHKLLETKEAEKTQTTGDAPESIKWVLYFLAQHYDHYRTRDSKKALEFINRAIDTSPTVEVQMTLARIHKHTGDLQKAMEIMNKARETDLKDRFINTKCAKYQLRNNCSDEALQTMSLFTRNEANGGPLGDLLEMQCVWYLTEDAESYSRQKRFGLALKRYHSIWKIFDDWTEDQFDFHSFSLRKGQIRAYIEMIRWEHTLRSHPFFARAALGAIKAYIQLTDRPHLAHGSLVNGVNGAVDFDSLNTADRKKALKKAKREAQKQQEKEAAQRAVKKDEKKTTGDEGAKKEDDDPRGEKLAQTTNPLGDAMKFLTPLLELSPQRLEVQLQGFEVYIRKEKYLLALKCLLAAAKIAPENPSVYEQIIRFKKAIDSRKEPLLVDVTTVIDATFYPTLLPSKDSDLVAFNNTYLAKHKDTPSELFGALRAKHFLDPASTSEIETIVLKDIKACLKSYTLDDVYDGLTLLGDIKASDKGIGEFKLTAKGRWENASRLS